MLEKAKEKGITTWIEPFVGGGNLIDKVPSSFKRIGLDYNEHTIQALITIRDYVDVLPDTCTEEYYKQIKGSKPKPIDSWIRFVCSFGGRFDEGYARSVIKGKVRNICSEGKRNAQKQSPNLQNVELIHCSYDDYNYPSNCVIYCDPPYQGTKHYRMSKLDYDKFWNWVREMSKTNLVFVSEYNAPDDFESIWEGSVKTCFASQRTETTHNATEKLFIKKLAF